MTFSIFIYIFKNKSLNEFFTLIKQNPGQGRRS